MMKLAVFKSHQSRLMSNIQQPSGEFVPAHFHITEVGLLTKCFPACDDGHIQKQDYLQTWVADNVQHHLEPKDSEMKFKYQADAMGKYGVGTPGASFLLVSKQTGCLFKIKCDISHQKKRIGLNSFATSKDSHCTTGGGCC